MVLSPSRHLPHICPIAESNLIIRPQHRLDRKTSCLNEAPSSKVEVSENVKFREKFTGPLTNVKRRTRDTAETAHLMPNSDAFSLAL